MSKLNSLKRITTIAGFVMGIGTGGGLLAQPSEGHGNSDRAPIQPPGHARPPFRLNTDWAMQPLATTSPTGLIPSAVRKFYGFDLIANTGAGQIIGIVTAFDNPNVEADLGVFDTKFALATCTTANGCFKKIYATGVKPATDATWALETSLDVQWAHALAPAAKIYLVEAATNSIDDLMRAVDVAVQNGASVVSMSFGSVEYSAEINYDSHFYPAKVTFIAASGDSGTGASYPAASRYVLAVGGTTPTLGTNNVYVSETSWSGSGGGYSKYELMPSYQSGLPVPYATSFRSLPDVAFIADPAKGFAVYSSVPYGGLTGWFQVGGTSGGTPQWAALAAIANSMRVAAAKQVMGATATATLPYLVYTLAKPAVYATNYHDITNGTNGTCGATCTAAAGYDYVTGLGSPKANAVINSLVAQP